MAAKKATAKATRNAKSAVRAPRSIKKSEAKPQVMEMKVSESTKKSSRKTLYVLIVLGVLIGFGYYFKSFFVAAVVNGEPIARLSVLQEVERQGGKQVLETLINERIIMQEARVKGINVTQDEIDNEIASIEDQITAQGQTLDQVLTLQGISREEFDKQIKIQVIIKKMVSDKISVTDDEVSKYMEDNKDFLPESSDEAQLKTDVREQLTQQKISEEFQSLLSDLRTKAKVNYFVSY